MRRTKRTKSERGAALVEYALLVALIALVAIPTVDILGLKIYCQFTLVREPLGEESVGYDLCKEWKDNGDYIVDWLRSYVRSGGR